MDNPVLSEVLHKSKHNIKLSQLKTVMNLHLSQIWFISPFNRVSSPAGCHQSSEGLRALFWNGRPVCLIDDHEEDLAHRETLEETRACVHLPHCIPPGLLPQLRRHVARLMHAAMHSSVKESCVYVYAQVVAEHQPTSCTVKHYEPM